MMRGESDAILDGREKHKMPAPAEGEDDGDPNRMTTNPATLKIPAATSSQPPKVSRWERFAFESLRTLIRLAVGTLSLSGLYQLGRGFATVEWLINFKRRRRFAARLAAILGNGLTAAERRMHTRRHFVRTRCDKLFNLTFDHLSDRQVLDRFEIVNRHLLDDALARGRGAYVALSHLGAHHVVGMLLMRLGYKVAGVRNAKEGALQRFIKDKYEQRSRDRVRYFFANSYPRDVYRCFHDNFVLGSAIDVHQVRGDNLRTMQTTVFGQERSMLIGPMQIAVRCGAPVLQGSIISRKNFHYVFELQGPLIDPAVEQESSKVLKQAVDRYAVNLERFCRQHPCHVSRV